MEFLIKSLHFGFTVCLGLRLAAPDLWQACGVNIPAWSIWEYVSGGGRNSNFVLCLRPSRFWGLSVISGSIVTIAKTIIPCFVLPPRPSGFSLSATGLGRFLIAVSEEW